MTIDEFIRTYGIRPADAIIMKKKLFGMVDHYVIYLGIERGQHIFVANYTRGVQVIGVNEITRFLKELIPTSIDKFPGPDHERVEAVKRAKSRIGQKAYDYIANNCEHFKNWVHSGVHRSFQSENFTNGVAAIAGTLLLVALVDALTD